MKLNHRKTRRFSVQQAKKSRTVVRYLKINGKPRRIAVEADYWRVLGQITTIRKMTLADLIAEIMTVDSVSVAATVRNYVEQYVLREALAETPKAA